MVMNLLLGFVGRIAKVVGIGTFLMMRHLRKMTSRMRDDQPNLMTCLRRALSEELGILRKTQEKCIPTSQITF